MELTWLACQNVVFAEELASLPAHCDFVPLLDHVFRGLNNGRIVLFGLVDVGTGAFIQNHVRVKCNGPLARQDKSDFGDVALLLKDVAVIRGRIVVPGHESEGHLVHEVAVRAGRARKERQKALVGQDVVEQELGHDCFLDIERDAVKVILLF